VARRLADGAEDILTDDHRSTEFVDVKPPLGELVYNVTARDAAGNRSARASCEVVMGAVP
jgi:hypothetical protein